MKESFLFENKNTQTEKGEEKIQFNQDYVARYYEYVKMPSSEKETTIMYSLHAPQNTNQNTEHQWLVKKHIQQKDGSYYLSGSKEISFNEGVELVEKQGYSKAGKELLTLAAKEALKKGKQQTD